MYLFFFHVSHAHRDLHSFPTRRSSDLFLLGLDPASRQHRRQREAHEQRQDRKSTRLNSSHLGISYAVFCLKKKNSRSVADRTVPSRRRTSTAVSPDSSPSPHGSAPTST